MNHFTKGSWKEITDIQTEAVLQRQIGLDVFYLPCELCALFFPVSPVFLLPVVCCLNTPEMITNDAPKGKTAYF